MRFLIFALLVFSNSFGQKEHELVRQCFAGYKSALLNDDGEKALQLIDSRTRKYYVRILDDVKMADSVKINSLPLMDKVTILALRCRASKEKILEMKGLDAFIYAINNGMVGKNGITNNTIGEVVVEGTFAKGQIISSGKKTPLYFHFYKEEGLWKLDLTSVFPISNMAFKKMLAESGKDENEALFEILEVLAGKKITSGIWNPLSGDNP